MKYQHLTLHQGYEIKAYLKCNKSQKFIAQQIGTNKLVRQYFPKGTYFEKISKEKIKEIQHKINRRPRTAKHITNTLPLKTIKSE
ncbi:hypothetical protein [Capnocytophaga canimorsus]|uniref:hypothetical protein n=1 Tax=Capnocytophaga canimorsus TaxID=28188 RepID=UPI00156203A9|nr:hypothetical protein [Capnocytophaga canimorsus]WGU68951.1 hypothetical protein QIU19_03415 [Capnocytophaga canimorsus]WGU69936.1 hypothetical protein QIU18_10240 [Capnocytophaga canimorsus]